ncbi:MAG: cyclic pyranopterin monophosphate synthase MoaC [Candidatus Omnitrophica bacterium]|nr:cyclic pyranopterin monophosphate synthase MoaC [Candidatus Omnitrophota bacterium]
MQYWRVVFVAKKIGMIDVGAKEKTKREALAKVSVLLPGEIIDRIKRDDMPKGNVLEAARIAGIMAAKRTDELIPLCHNIEIECVDVEFRLEENKIQVQSRVKSTAKTGVEMEALLACSVAALTVYDMSKMFTQEIEITGLCLIEKQGGKSGIYRRKSS